MEDVLASAAAALPAFVFVGVLSPSRRFDLISISPFFSRRFPTVF
jgi:hypothetical protein